MGGSTLAEEVIATVVQAMLAVFGHGDAREDCRGDGGDEGDLGHCFWRGLGEDGGGFEKSSTVKKGFDVENKVDEPLLL